LHLRSHSKSFINNNEILEIVTNGIGIDKISEMIKERLATLGTSESSYNGTISVKDQKVVTGA